MGWDNLGKARAQATNDAGKKFDFERARAPMEEDERQEASASTSTSTSSLNPDFKPACVSQKQLDKFLELQRKRLQIQSKFKEKLKPRNPHVAEKKKKVQAMVAKKKDGSDETECTDADESKVKSCVARVSSSKVDIPQVLTKRQKLHWGLDTKERWERKANM